MTGAKSNGFASVFIFTKFTSQFRKLKSRDCQMKFAMNQSRLRNVEAGTQPLLLGKPKFITLVDVLYRQDPQIFRVSRLGLN